MTPTKIKMHYQFLDESAENLEGLKEVGNLNQKISERELDFLLKEEDHSMNIEELNEAVFPKSELDLKKINSYLDTLLRELSMISQEIKSLSNNPLST